MAKQKKDQKDARLARALADYQNLVKRFEKEKEAVIRRANKALIGELLPVLDVLELAQTHLKDPGLEIAIVQFKNTLKQVGIDEIKTKIGDKFDEAIHEAIEAREGGKSEMIAGISRKGYIWSADKQVLRPCQVIVYK